MRNVVGYQGLKTSEEGKGQKFHKYPFVGLTFQNIGAQGQKVKLGDIKPTGMRGAYGDYLYILRTDTATPDASSQITYMDLDNAWAYWDPGQDYFTEEEMKGYVGWWSLPLPEYPDDPGAEDSRIDSKDYPCSTAFLGHFGGTYEIEFTCSGAVQNESVNASVSKTKDKNNVKYPIFCNPIPRDVKYKEIAVSGMRGAYNDYLYLLNQDKATPDASSQITYMDLDNAWAYWDPGQDYFTEEEMKGYVGWWTLPLPEYPDDPGADEQLLNKDTDVWSAGKGYLGHFGGTYEIIVSFPEGVPAASAE